MRLDRRSIATPDRACSERAHTRTGSSGRDGHDHHRHKFHHSLHNGGHHRVRARTGGNPVSLLRSSGICLASMRSRGAQLKPSMINQCYDRADNHTRVGMFEVDSRDGDHRRRLALDSSLFCYINSAPKHLVIPF